MESCHDNIQNSYRFVRFLEKKKMSNALKIITILFAFEINKECQKHAGKINKFVWILKN